MDSEINMKLTFAPGYTSENYPSGIRGLPIDQQIDAFDKSYRFWVLEFAETLVNIPNSGFAVLTLLNAYPEMIAQLKGYQKDKLSLFQIEIANIFPDISYVYYPEGDIISEHLYSFMRSGLAHMSFTSTNIVLSEDFPSPLVVMRRNGERVLCVNPRKWYERIRFHFERYVQALKNPDNVDLRDKFSARINKPF